jgi:hypothetical protein
MRIYVRIRVFGDALHPLEVEPHDTVLKVKELILKEHRILVEPQRLVFAAEDLQNDRTLRDYNIQPETIVTLLVDNPFDAVMYMAD